MTGDCHLAKASIAVPPKPMSEAGSVSLRQLALPSGVAEAVLRDRINYGALSSIAVQVRTEVAAVRSIPTLQQAQMLRADLALDSRAFTLTVNLSSEIADLEAEFHGAKATDIDAV